MSGSPGSLESLALKDIRDLINCSTDRITKFGPKKDVLFPPELKESLLFFPQREVAQKGY